MLAFYSFLASLLWGSLIGAGMGGGNDLDKIPLRKSHAVIGAALLTVPALVTFVRTPVSGRALVIAGIAAAAAFLIGLRVGRTTYRID